jgi:hypothetical protein
LVTLPFLNTVLLSAFIEKLFAVSNASEKPFDSVDMRGVGFSTGGYTGTVPVTDMVIKYLTSQLTILTVFSLGETIADTTC